MTVTKMDNIKNTSKVVKGKVNEVAGKTTGDKKLEVTGTADQMMGHAKQTGEKAKDAFKR